jgi:hypothetical protein
LIAFMPLNHENAIVNTMKADGVYDDYRKRAFRIGEEVPKGRNDLPTPRGRNRHGLSSNEANPCRALSPTLRPLDCNPDHLT